MYSILKGQTFSQFCVSNTRCLFQSTLTEKLTQFERLAMLPDTNVLRKTLSILWLTFL